MTTEAQIEDLSPDFHFHKPLQNGVIQLESRISTGPSTPLFDSELVALTLNDIAATRGEEKIFWLPSMASLEETGLSYDPMPDLVYFNWDWSPNDKTAYFQKT